MTEEEIIDNEFEVDWKKLREEFFPSIILKEEVILRDGIRCVKVEMEGLGEVICELEEREDAGDFHHWNYRVMKQGDEYRIVEVHYRENGEITSWVDCGDSNFKGWDDPKELLGTYKYIGHAFEKPILELVDDRPWEIEPVVSPVYNEKLREIKGSTLVKKYNLEELISQVTPENRHEETDWGAPVGKDMEKTIDYYMGLPYKIVLYPAVEGGYVVEIPELRGCISQGDDAEDALKMIEDAKLCWLEIALEDGKEIPEPSDA